MKSAKKAWEEKGDNAVLLKQAKASIEDTKKNAIAASVNKLLSYGSYAIAKKKNIQAEKGKPVAEAKKIVGKPAVLSNNPAGVLQRGIYPIISGAKNAHSKIAGENLSNFYSAMASMRKAVQSKGKMIEGLLLHPASRKKPTLS